MHLCFEKEAITKVYSQYCARQHQATELLIQRRGHSVVAAALEARRRELGHALTLADQLLAPVQRLMRYPMLLEEQLRHDDHDGGNGGGGGGGGDGGIKANDQREEDRKNAGGGGGGGDDMKATTSAT
eukprot:UC1_evm1s1283